MTVEQDAARTPGPVPGRTPERTPVPVPAPAGPPLAAVGAAMAGLARLRSGRKAAHPAGRTHPGVVRRVGLDPAVGVAWLDEPGTDEVVVRLSRGAGLPPGLPDLLGLALRLRGEDGSRRDLLLSSAGLSPVGRHLLALRRDPERSAYTSVVSHRSPTGPLLLAAVPSPGDVGFVLATASPAGPWRPFAHLEVDTSEVLPDVVFDPVLHALPGLPPVPWMAAVRRSAYAGSRRGRGVRLDAE